ncbi:glycine-rich RNA-binding, abscisic acid-inducible protein-like isoform X1 [Trifolium pratense]|uniref:glycine-rich RNA-binding, abscisic acid-inducible protein-like isoform X1 n=1 Tax=Trifolium pratense TaxID=57577 RepID=UPI001E6907C6|nr:glycine-rich RNA-binding, abscisic acid-inducible protein-like isoform X1 [Trifolium pratense]
MKMKISIFLALFLVIMISCVQVISNENEERSLIHTNEQAHEIIGNSNGNGTIEASTRLNNKDVLVQTQNEHKHDLFVTIRKGGKGGGGGGIGGRGMGRGGGAAAGIIGGGVIGGETVHHGHNHVHNHGHNQGHNYFHVCVSTFILCLSFWF